MDAEEAALLAELRAISAQSSAATRFAGNEEDVDDDRAAAAPAPAPSPPSFPEAVSASASSRTRTASSTKAVSKAESLVAAGDTRRKEKSPAGDGSLPPWKRKSRVSSSAVGGGGGGGGSGFDVEIAALPAPAPSLALASPPSADIDTDTRGRTQRAAGGGVGGGRESFPSNVGEAAEEPTVPADAGAEQPSAAQVDKGGFRAQSTFRGERGGSAEDADLLAALRAISNKSAENRFRDEGDDDVAIAGATITEDIDTKEKSSKEPLERSLSAVQDGSDLPPWKDGKSTSKPTGPGTKADAGAVPPWKRKGKKQGSGPGAVEIAIAGNPPSAVPAEVDSDPAGTEPPVTVTAKEVNADKEDRKCFKMGSTFQGERGGVAEDADLLAALRAISNKSAENRFKGEDDDNDLGAGAGTVTEEEVCTKDVKSSEISSSAAQDGSDLPPRKRGESPVKKVTGKKAAVGEVPPWKRKGKRKDEGTGLAEIAVSGVPPSANSAEESSGVEPLIAEAVEEKPKTEQQDEGGFKVESTFQGERGGVAEDADLLAALRAISNKSAGDRFRGEDDDVGPGVGTSNKEEIGANTKKEVGTSMEKSSNASLSAAQDGSDLPPWKREKSTKKTSNGTKAVAKGTPPWKRKGKKQEDGAGEVDADVTGTRYSATSAEVESKPAGAELPVALTAEEPNAEQEDEGGFKVKSTFQGERGGAAEDADLLAALRAISNKSAGDRFRGEDDDVGPGVGTSNKEEVGTIVEKSSRTSSSAAQDGSDLPPWKSGKSAKTVTETTTGAKAAAGGVPPWKRKGKKQGEETKSAKASVTNASPSGASAEVEPPFSGVGPPALVRAEEEPSMKQEEKGGLKVKSTFQGERGGVAEDADLLAALRAISNKAAGDRFRGGDDELDESPAGEVCSKESGSSELAPPIQENGSDLPPWKRRNVTKKAATRSKPSRNTPPWKRNVAKQGGPADSTEAKVSAAPPNSFPVEHEVEDTSSAPPGVHFVANEDGGGFQSVSTFKGERGGAAEDAALLAELRAISANSGSKDRFRGDDGDDHCSGAVDASGDVSQMEMPSRDSMPPWKRAKVKKTQTKSRNEANGVPPRKEKTIKKAGTVADAGEADGAGETKIANDSPSQHQLSTNNFKSSTPSTFRGDRGGAAEDPDLLAELKAISARSRGAGSAAVNEDSSNEDQSKEPKSAPAKEPFYQTPAAARPPPTSNMPPQQPEECLVTEETLSSSLESKDWKLRKAAYELLTKLLEEKVGNKPATGEIDGDSIMDSLDKTVPTMVKDSNAAALEAALIFSVLYADHCKGASNSEHAAKVVTSLFKGTAPSSSRPATVTNCKSLVLKLMEVGCDGTESVHAVVEVLLSQGFTSRKPKVVLNAVNFILDAARAYGAGSLPLGAVSANAPKILSHSNPQVREAGMNIIAEICRAAGSKTPLQSVMDTLKTSQMSQLDSLLEEQSSSLPPQVGLRSKKNSPDSGESAIDVLAALEAGSKEEEMKRFAARPAVNIFEQLRKTEYASKLKLSKWSEKVAAVDLLLKCGGEQPYKLAQPSSAVNYQPLISDLKKLLDHTHFAVNSKAMTAFSMLAEGVGLSLFPYLRPLLPVLIGLSKDKKLTSAVAQCLDSFYGNVLSLDHLLDKDDALPTALDEKKEKNALVRTSSLEFLVRCIERGDDAGPRGSVSANNAEQIANLACQKLKDSDAQPRKAALEVLQRLLGSEDDNVSGVTMQVVENIKTDSPRAYKQLMAAKPGSTTPTNSAQGGLPKSSKQPKTVDESSMAEVKKESKPSSARRPRKAEPKQEQKRPAVTSKRGSKPAAAAMDITEEPEKCDIPSYDEGLETIALLALPNWDAAEDEGGVLAGLKSSDWKLRKAAIESLKAFAMSDQFNDSSSTIPSGAMLVVVKEHTKGFKESNFNVVKAIMELFLALCHVHESHRLPLDYWICKAGVSLCVEKIADRKFASVAPPLLTAFCVIRSPATISGLCVKTVEKIKSPLQHEALLQWHKGMVVDFGASTLGGGVKSIITWVQTECESSNMKVRKASLELIGELHVQMGPVFKALLFSNEFSAPIKSQIEGTLDSCPFDPNAAQSPRDKTCITNASSGVGGGHTDAADGGLSLDLAVPKTDLVASLPSECLSRLGAKEGKNSWKIRKEAMEEVSTCLDKCSGLVSTEAHCFKSLVELARALRDRLGDSQSNLKPQAAKIIGTLLSSVDGSAQAKLGKIFFPPLINGAMNDNKKIMREAAISSLKEGVTLSALEGGGPSSLSLESYMSSLVSELKDSDFKAIGLPEVLNLLSEYAEFIPKVESMSSSKAQALETQFTALLVACLTSSKSETRAAAETLLRACSENAIICNSSIEQGVKKLFPAQQRAVRPVISQFQSEGDSQPDKENGSSRIKPAKLSARPGSKNNSSLPPELPQTSSKTLGRLSPDRHPFRKPACSKGNSESIKQEQSEDTDTVQTEVNSTQHPLDSSTANASTKEIRSSSLFKKRENWPDYPEDPCSSFASLKKSWAPLLPTSSVEALFPKTGIQKQEDAVLGCEVLSRALEMDRKNDGSIVLDQLDLIHKWLACCLSSREHTVGMQAILSLLSDIFTFLKERSYQMSDCEATVLLPYMMEKASASKGRFREMLQDAISTILEGNLYPPQKYGPLICVLVIERSGHAKARALATRECLSCVEMGGLSGIGKKGIQTTAKAFSEESLPENKALFLDLSIAVVTKMNGDVNKYAKLCGSANLSDKARELIEERLVKQTKPESSPSSEQGSSRLGRGQRRRSVARSTSSSGRKCIPSFSSSPALGSKDGTRTLKPKRASLLRGPSGIPQKEDTTSLSLRLGDASVSDNNSTDFEAIGPISKDGPFTFCYSKKTSDAVLTNQSPLRTGSSLSLLQAWERQQECGSDLRKQPGLVSIEATYRKHEIETAQVQESVKDGTDSAKTAIGTAASLRARLEQIRSKHRSSTPVREDDSSTEGIKEYELPMPPRTEYVSPERPHDFDLVLPPKPPRADNPIGVETPYEVVMSDLDALLRRQKPLAENDISITRASDALEKLHASLSKQPKTHVYDPVELESLRRSVKSNMCNFVDCLMRVLEFGFDCGPSDRAGGISMRLVTLAVSTGQTIFVDEDLSALVSKSDTLCLLIRQTVTGLLDSRLAQSTGSSLGQSVDEREGQRLTKCINKLAIQAAVSSPRHAAFQALMSLQLKFCTANAQSEDGGADSGNLNCRLSRVITKLCSRVVKTEESALAPYSVEGLDIETLLCALEDTLVAINATQRKCGNHTAMEPCSSMIRSIMVSILKTKNGGKVAEYLRKSMTELGIHPYDSLLGKMLSSCDTDLNCKPSENETPVSLNRVVEDSTRSLRRGESEAHSHSSSENYDDVTLARLLSDIAKADDRSQSLGALRTFVARNPTVDIRSHLEPLSAPFQAYILEQLKLSLPDYQSQVDTQRLPSEGVEKRSPETARSLPMSERIRYLKSRLNATEAAVQSVVTDNIETPSSYPPSPRADESRNVSHTSDQTRSKSVTSLRERLAAANSSRTVSRPTANDPSSALGHAAALRARLEAARTRKQKS